MVSHEGKREPATVFIELKCERSILYHLLLPWSVHCCWLWQQERKKFTKKDSVVKFSRVPKFVKNESEVIEELTTRRRRAWISGIIRTISLKMRGFVLGILSGQAAQLSGTNVRIHVERVTAIDYLLCSE